MNLRAYSRAEYWSDAAVHLLGLVVVAVAVPVLVLTAVASGRGGAEVVGVAVYATTLVAMLTFSALCNMIQRPGWHGLLRRLDHSAIYLKIAGTYTPFTLISGQGIGLMAGLWAAAAGGAALKVLSPDRLRWTTLALYVGMGWAGLFAGRELMAELSPRTTALIVTGGAIYTLGLVPFLWTRLRFHNTIWHVFVLAATLVLYAAVMAEVTVRTSGAGLGI